MSGDRKRVSGLERLLATTLQFGTWTGSCLIAVGWVLSATGKPPSLPIAALVLAVVVVGAALGVRMAGVVPG